MFFTKERLQTALTALREEADNIKRIIWCEDFECNEYERETLQYLSQHLADVERMIETYTDILRVQYGVAV